MGTVDRFEDFKCWKEARELSKKVYAISKTGEFSKDFKLRDQIRGAVGSIMDNVAEGFERGGRKEFIQFLSIAKASAGEVRSQLYRAYDQDYIDKNKFDELIEECTEIGKMISGLMTYLSSSNIKGSKYKSIK